MTGRLHLLRYAVCLADPTNCFLLRPALGPKRVPSVLIVTVTPFLHTLAATPAYDLANSDLHSLAIASSAKSEECYRTLVIPKVVLVFYELSSSTAQLVHFGEELPENGLTATELTRDWALARTVPNCVFGDHLAQRILIAPGKSLMGLSMQCCVWMFAHDSPLSEIRLCQNKLLQYNRSPD
jgi:hypothetical protein